MHSSRGAHSSSPSASILLTLVDTCWLRLRLEPDRSAACWAASLAAQSSSDCLDCAYLYFGRSVAPFRQNKTQIYLDLIFARLSTYFRTRSLCFRATKWALLGLVWARASLDDASWLLSAASACAIQSDRSTRTSWSCQWQVLAPSSELVQVCVRLCCADR